MRGEAGLLGKERVLGTKVGLDIEKLKKKEKLQGKLQVKRPKGGRKWEK
jgi:hypothetical protein